MWSRKLGYISQRRHPGVMFNIGRRTRNLVLCAATGAVAIVVIAAIVWFQEDRR